VARAHLGVDYAAPHGSAVVAVADGVVVSAAWSGGGGNTVRIRHAGGLETYYLHLSSFAKGVRGGARVRQNQVIGRVGATGTATGSHLDYRMRRNGAFVNPITAPAAAARRADPRGAHREPMRAPTKRCSSVATRAEARAGNRRRGSGQRAVTAGSRHCSGTVAAHSCRCFRS
jgi:murein DD-endopeptidase MepM/ murein hydrolase activator NlpD